MYGFCGYGTNPYGSERKGISSPIVTLGMRIVRSGYSIAMILNLKYRNLTLSNPETNQRTLEL